MRSTLRTIIAILLFFALLALVLAGALTLYATPDRLTAKAAAMLEDRLGLRAELVGSASVKRLPKLVLTLPAGDLSRTVDGTHAGKFASAVIELAPWSLFAQSPRVERVSVDRLELDGVSYETLLKSASNTSGAQLWDIDRLELTQASIRFGALPHVGAGTLAALDAEFSSLSEAGGTVRLLGTLTLPEAEGLWASNSEVRGVQGALGFAGAFTFDADKTLVLQLPALTFDGLSGASSLKFAASADRIEGASAEHPWEMQNLVTETTLGDQLRLSAHAPKALISVDSIAAENVSAQGSAALGRGRWSIAGSGSLAADWAAGTMKLVGLDLSSAPEGNAAAPASRLSGSIEWSAESLAANLEGSIFDAAARIHLEQPQDGAVLGTIAFGTTSVGMLEELSPVWSQLLSKGEHVGRDFRIGLTAGSLEGFGLTLTDLSAELSRTQDALSLANGRAKSITRRSSPRSSTA